MKKIALIIIVIALALTDINAQGPFFVNGKRAQFTAPKGITANSDFLFPTFDLQVKSYADTINVKASQLITYVKCDTVRGDGLVIISPASYVLPGAHLYLQVGNDTTGRTLTIKQGSYVLDTIPVGNGNVKRQYLYNGTKYEVFK